MDAVAETLRQVGGYPSERITRLKAPTPDRARAAIVDLGLQIQRDVRAGAEAVLLVFYSGHGDGQSLHLGGADLSTDNGAGLATPVDDVRAVYITIVHTVVCGPLNAGRDESQGRHGADSGKYSQSDRSLRLVQGRELYTVPLV